MRLNMSYFQQFKKNLIKNGGYKALLVQMGIGFVGVILASIVVIIPLFATLYQPLQENALTAQEDMGRLFENVGPPVFLIIFLLLFMLLLVVVYLFAGTQYALTLAVQGQLQKGRLWTSILEGGRKYVVRILSVFFAIGVIQFVLTDMNIALWSESSILFENAFMREMVFETPMAFTILSYGLTYLTLLFMPFVYALTFKEGARKITKMFLRKHPVLFFGVPFVFLLMGVVPILTLLLLIPSIFIPIYYMTIFAEDMRSDTEQETSDDLSTED